MNSQNNAGLYVALVAIVIAVGALVVNVTGQSGPSAGGSGSRFPNGVSADATSPTVGQVRGATATFTGTVTQSTSNTATTTLAVGCIQTTATSTVTPIKLTVTLGGLATGTVAGLANNAGYVVAAYGNCP